MTTPEEYYTYDNNRECLNCSAPIADQEHAATKFCERQVMPDGSIKSCKDDYHSAKNKEKNAPFLKLYNYHKKALEQIEKLQSHKGDTVTTEQLNQYGIRLDMPVKYDLNPAGKSTFYFIDYCFTRITQFTFKISRHENNF